jgi:VanZ family protein
MALTIFWMCLIWLVSSIPAKGIPELDVMALDKLAHFSIYCIWAVLGRLLMQSRSNRPLECTLLLIFMLSLAVLDEYHQNWIPGRSVSTYDLYANFFGILTGWSITSICLKRRKL